ncbi:hypothetical protein GCM10022247_24100 [Allokutzneria multivorans]|uniref:Uncharacterized protein n=1 Tax=Allokutzneria multivorans TaxID=1142134 RepID=A0ABP7RUN0_9PSEU
MGLLSPPRLILVTPVGWGGAAAPPPTYPRRVEWFFTGLIGLAALLTLWFAGYVVYRLYSDQR